MSVSLLLALVAGLGGGCAGPSSAGGATKGGVVSSGLAGLDDQPTEETSPEADAEIERMIAESAQRLEKYFAQDSPLGNQDKTDAGDASQVAADDADPGFSSLAALDEAPTTPAIQPVKASPKPATQSTPKPKPQSTASDPADVALSDAYALRGVPPKVQVRGSDGIDFLVALGADPKKASDGAGSGTREELIARLTESLRALVEDASNPDEAYRAAAALAGLEAIEPGAVDRISKTSTLTPEQLEVIRAAGDMARALGDPAERLDADRASDLMERLSRRLAAARGLRITHATLCTRVQGFGRYEEFPANVFLAGRAQPVIVYVEVDGFTSDPIEGNSGEPLHEVKLSQRLELYHASDGLNTWNRAAETDRTVSRNQLHDYYLINQVVLPANLGVGKYMLKVVMRDLNSERGAMDESLIPIEIVSDPSIAFPNAARVSAAP
ncbi:MAG: hypothetical protein R3B57_05865 [Phycisphaerales bacterium]